MRAHLVGAASAVAVLVTAAPVHAQERTAYQTIAAERYDVAERRLVAQRRASPERPELTLNLAAVYLKTGRTAEARALYADVLDRPAVAMDLLSGRTASSHDVAGTALASLNAPNAIAAR